MRLARRSTAAWSRIARGAHDSSVSSSGVGRAVAVEPLEQPFHPVAVLVGGVAAELERRHGAQAHPPAELAAQERGGRREAVAGLTLALGVADDREEDPGVRPVRRQLDRGDGDVRRAVDP